jgi:mannose-1-phosphate guanylyltransferase/mannose-6-phosphate isomerase
MSEKNWTERPWGKYKVISKGPGFVAKHLVINPGGKTSLQSHEGREEFWTISSGAARIHFGRDENNIFHATVFPGNTWKVEKGELHRIENEKDYDLHIIEVWRGEILSEEDIKRYEDSYGRV